ncbi:MAG: hypothetical protein ACJAS9_001905 [Polaribacter sp.]
MTYQGIPYEDKDGSSVIYQEGVLKTYTEADAKRITKSKWTGMRAKEKPFTATLGSSETGILGVGVELLSNKKGGILFSVVDNNNRHPE